MIDFHCHVDLYPDPGSVLDRAEAHGVYLLAVTTTPRAWVGTKRLIGTRQRVRAAIGLHPELVAERHSEVQLLVSLLPESRYVGEIGIDGSPRHRSAFALQERVLARVLRGCAEHGGRVLSVHSRGAATGVLDALSGEPTAGTAILHWFSGTLRELDRAVAMGCWFSVGPAMLRTAKGRKLAEGMPRERLLTETDAPFARAGGKPLMPWDVSDAEAALAAVWGEPEAVVRATVRANLRALA